MTVHTSERLKERLTRIGGFDTHIIGTLLFRGWALLAGIVTMLLVPIYLPREHQGFYFTFSSLISIQIFFELGFNHVISQLVSHEAALAHEAVGDEKRQYHIARLASVHILARRWYRVMATLFFAVAFITGFIFFKAQDALPTSQWWAPWAILCFSSALNLYASPLLAICEGLGRVDRVARLRLIQSIIGYLGMWTLLLLHGRLWAATLVPTVAAIFSLWWIGNPEEQDFPPSATPFAGDAAITWLEDVFPLQWRIALSWMSGYFIFQIFNPFIFAYHGATAAGKAGLALAAYTAILGLGMSWVNATSPKLSAAIARGARQELRLTFRRVATRSLAFTILATLVLITVRAGAAYAGLSIADRIADESTLLLMGLATVGNCAIGAMAIFMRCHKEEPMLWNSLAMAALTLATVGLSSRYDIHWPFGLYAAIIVFIALPWTIVIFHRYWKR
ncbi:hypothetical protein [Ideonella dechloratans]|uniref:hypothetical protein n=1 Tax=Ideonella dechloratans TaxID=36863 RepID=UPI0035B2649A